MFHMAVFNTYFLELTKFSTTVIKYVPKNPSSVTAISFKTVKVPPLCFLQQPHLSFSQCQGFRIAIKFEKWTTSS